MFREQGLDFWIPRVRGVIGIISGLYRVTWDYIGVI